MMTLIYKSCSLKVRAMAYKPMKSFKASSRPCPISRQNVINSKTRLNIYKLAEMSLMFSNEKHILWLYRRFSCITVCPGWKSASFSFISVFWAQADKERRIL